MSESESPYRATNTAILQQIGQPPPTSVLATLLQFTPLAPEHIATFVTDADDKTEWRVVACIPGGILEVLGQKPEKDWRGGRSRDDGSGDDVAAYFHPFRTVRMVKFKLERAYRDHLGEIGNVIGSWTLTFEGGATLTLNVNAARGHLTLAGIDGIVTAALEAQGPR